MSWLKFWVPIALALLVGLAGCAKNALLSPAEFTTEFAGRLRTAIPDSQVSVLGELELRIRDKTGAEHTAYLDNCYAEYKRAPADKDATIGKFVSAATESDILAEETPAVSIVPVIKDLAWIDDVRRSMGDSGSKPAGEFVHEPFAGGLEIVYAVDSPKNLRYLTPDDLRKSGVSRAELRAQAVKNLRAILPDLEVHGGQGVFMLTAGGNFEASLMLFDELWRERKFAVRGDYVVAVPSRDLLLITGSNEDDGIRRVRAMVAKTHAGGSYLVSRDLFVYRNGQFSKFVE